MGTGRSRTAGNTGPSNRRLTAWSGGLDEGPPGPSTPVDCLRLDRPTGHSGSTRGSLREDSGICRKHHRIVCCQIPYGASRAVRESLRSPSRPALPSPSFGVRNAVIGLRGPPSRPAARARPGRGVDHAGAAAQGRRGRGTAGRPLRRHGPRGALAARPVRPSAEPTGRFRRPLGSIAQRTRAPAPGHRAPGARRGTRRPPGPGRRPARRAAQPGRQRGVEPAHRRGVLVRGVVPDPRPRPRPARPHPGRTALAGRGGGPAEADLDGHGLSDRRPPDRRRVPGAPPRRLRAQRAHDGRAGARRRRRHRLDVGRAARCQHAAPQPAHGARDT